MATPDFDHLRRLYTDATRATFAGLRDAHPDEDFYAYALYTDDDGVTPSPAASSEWSLEYTASRYSKKGFEVDEAELHRLRYCPDEWQYCGSNSEEWEAASALQDEVAAPYSARGDHEGFRDGLLGMMMGCLRDLDREGFFGAGAQRDAVTLMVWVTDSEVARDWWVRSIRDLNPEPVFRRFAAGLEGR